MYALGVGIGHLGSISMVTTYYVTLIGLTLKYLFDSFRDPLPWSVCQDAWQQHAICVDSSISSLN